MNNFIQFIKNIKANFDKNFVSYCDGILTQAEIDAIINKED